MNETPTQPVEPPAFNPWALYGLAWALSVVRLLHAAVKARDEEIKRLRTENTELLNRLLKKQSTEPLPVNGVTSNGHYEPPVRRELKPPIASHNAQARAVEDAAVRQQRAREAATREAIRRDAEERKTA